VESALSICSNTLPDPFHSLRPLDGRIPSRNLLTLMPELAAERSTP
jgi:hypothetical protein